MNKCVACSMLLLFLGCAGYQHHEKATSHVSKQAEDKMVFDVKNAVLFSRKFRNNPNAVGGNENIYYEPSQYFDEFKPIWMSDYDVSHICLVAIIASDPQFDSSNWKSFYHGIEVEKRESVSNRVRDITRSQYEWIFSRYAFEPSLNYEEFRGKVKSFGELPLGE